MTRRGYILSCFIFLMFSMSNISHSQVEWIVGGRLGLSIASAGGSTSAGLQIGPVGEVLFQKQMAIGTEFNINTQSGTPVEWADYFKYYFLVRGSKIKPYANGGFSLWFFTGGPYFALRFGGGANFPIAKNLYVPADIQLGPVFVTGTTVFYLALTSGIRYDIP
ncbi:MAG: hypothetical protein O7D34_05590 [Ignavibacteria bacterium]|nr:hypothetical protein [Ignavibacteria bacterium]